MQSINDYITNSKRLEETQVKNLFYLSNNQITNWLNLSTPERIRLYKDLKDKKLLPPVSLRGLADKYLAIFWEYVQLIRLTDKANAYLTIDKIVRELKLNE
jgi:hypothetical protein